MAGLETERLELRPMVEDDARHFARLFADDWEAIKQTGRMPYPPTQRALRAWIAQHMGPGGHGFTIARRSDRAVLGAAGFGGDDEEAELGYALGRAYWNRGFATEAVRALIGYARALGLRRLDAYSFLDNPASARVLQKAGFEELEIAVRDYPQRGGPREVRHFRLILEGDA